MKYTSQTVSPHGSDVCSLLTRFASAKSCYKLTAMIMCRSDGAKNEKWKKKNQRDNKSFGGIATFGKSFEKTKYIAFCIIQNC